MKNTMKCDTCGKTATWNIQNIWVEYSIDDKENYEKTDEWEGDGNEFLCDRCHAGHDGG